MRHFDISFEWIILWVCNNQNITIQIAVFLAHKLNKRTFFISTGEQVNLSGFINGKGYDGIKYLLDFQKQHTVAAFSFGIQPFLNSNEFRHFFGLRGA